MFSVLKPAGVVMVLGFLAFITLSFLFIAVLAFTPDSSGSGQASSGLPDYPITREEFMHRCLEAKSTAQYGRLGVQSECNKEWNNR